MPGRLFCSAGAGFDVATKLHSIVAGPNSVKDGYDGDDCAIMEDASVHANLTIAKATKVVKKFFAILRLAIILAVVAVVVVAIVVVTIVVVATAEGW
jgi:hypothetical protein